MFTKPFSIIRQTKTYAEIVDQITSHIRQGELKPGDRLPPERTLAKELGTSRQCLREALSVLEAIGVLEVKHGRGTFVREDPQVNMMKLSGEAIEESNPFDALEVRLIFETEAVKFAAKRVQPEDIACIERLLLDAEAMVAQGGHSMEHNREVHLAFAKAAHNAVLYSALKELIDRTEKHIWVAVKERSLAVPGRAAKYHHEHKQILEAIKRGDSRKAAKYMRQHMTHIEQDLLNLHRGE